MIQQQWHNDQVDHSIGRATPASPPRPPPKRVAHPRQANFARPFNQPYYTADQWQMPPVDDYPPQPSIYDHRALSPRLKSHSDDSSRQHPAPGVSALQHSKIPSQLKIASNLPSVDEVPDVAGLEYSIHSRKTRGSDAQQDPSTVNRIASFSRNGKPYVKPIRRNDSSRSNQPIRESGALPAEDREQTMKALSEAIAAGLNSSSPTTPTWSETPTPEQNYDITKPSLTNSPTSTYTQEFHFPQVASDDHESVVTPDATEQHTGQDLLSPYALPPSTERSVSSNSANPLLGLGIHQHVTDASDKQKVPKEEADASVEPDTRQSITSLPDLIRRATRLASNLDRGKTASRLGLEDMLGYSSKKEGKHSRESTLSNFLNMFPPTGKSRSPSPSKSQQIPWVDDEKSAGQATSRARRNKNQVCGLSLKVFIFVLIVLVLLVAAAVLVPIFLILVPKENSSAGLRHCSISFPCQNGGISLVDNNACSCICVDGFTGNQCATAADPDCVTANLKQANVTYNSATLGNSVLPVLSQSQSLFGIHLNTSVLLSVFAVNNISCSGENSLVTFDTATTSRIQEKRKRLVILSDFEPEAPVLPVPSHTPEVTRSQRRALLAARQSSAATTSVASASNSSMTASPSASNSTSTITTQQTTFAEVVVLYVLTQTRTPSLAVNAQQLIEQYLLAGGVSSGNTSVEILRTEDDQLTADFAQYTILLGNGTKVG